VAVKMACLLTVNMGLNYIIRYDIMIRTLKITRQCYGDLVPFTGYCVCESMTEEKPRRT